MSRSHDDTTSSVSLFPFLAVLVCAMGALIFILLVTTHRLRQQAIAEARQKNQQQTTTPLPTEPLLPSLAPLPKPDRRPQFTQRPSHPRVVDPNIDLRATIARLARERDDLRGNLNRSRQAAAALRQQQSATETAVAQARSKRALIGHQQELERIAQHSLLKQQTGLVGQIRQADKRLKTTREKNVTATSQYAILPFDGKTGTTRRPILIECTRHGLRFLPEDVTLSQKQLDGFTAGYNPLLAGTKSLIQYWTSFAGSTRKRPSLPRDESGNRRHKPADPDSSRGRGGRVRREPAEPDGPKPYVLLIVRPGGSIPFYLARKFLARLGEPFGYELLEIDHKLALSGVDPDAQATVREAIDAVLAERARLIATIGRGGRTAGRGSSAQGRGVRSGYSAAGGRSSRYGSGLGGRSGTRRTPGQGVGSQGTGTKGRRSGSRSAGTPGNSGGTLGNPTRSTGIPKRSTPVSGQFGQRSSGQPSPGRRSPRRQQTGIRPSRNGKYTQSGRTASTNGSRTPGSRLARGGNPSQPFPQFGQQRAAGSRSSRTMQQPRRWGHSASRTGIGFERSVAVKISANRVTIGNRLFVPVGRGETRKQLIDQVAAAIDREARSWGSPPSGFYWVPSIHFEVLPGGNQFYERLNPTFRGWGLSTSARFPVGSSDESSIGD